MHRWIGLVLGAVSAIPLVSGGPDAKTERLGFTVETVNVKGGAELVTVFGPLPGRNPGQTSMAPLVSVLRDTLGDADPATDRLRYVWVLTSVRPSLTERAMASLPFFYFRPGLANGADQRPAPVIDLSSAARNVWSSVAQSVAQVMALDPNGAIVRTSTRSYRNNIEDHRRVQLLEGLAALSELRSDPQAAALLSEPDLIEIQTRLALAGQLLGGLVNADRLPEAYNKQRMRAEEMRGHNWELLRQRAESNGLYFQPLGNEESPGHAILWVATEDLGPHNYNGQFLGISNPFDDARLRRWKGYREVRDDREMIPLALYGLEYPKVPLLLVDFRNTWAPRYREILRHATTDTVIGVLGISRFTNLPFLAGSMAFNFVETRHGHTTSRAMRLKAYSDARQWLARDQSIDPALRAELQKRLESLGLNPMEESVSDEADIARRQYAALLRYAEDPKGLPAKLEHDRDAEMSAYRHSLTARASMKVGTYASLGAYSHHESEPDPGKLAEQRRIAHQTQFLAAVARSTPQTEIVWNMDDIRHALDQLSATRIPARSVPIVQRILRQTNDEETRALCQRALLGLDAAGSQ
jgi:hypothetical protein